jgi:hypothetical protein
VPNQRNVLMSFLDLLIFLEFFHVFLSIKEPRILFHVLIYGSGHTPRIDVRMSLWVDQGIFGLDVLNGSTIYQVDREDKTSDEKYQVPSQFGIHKTSNRE